MFPSFSDKRISFGVRVGSDSEVAETLYQMEKSMTRPASSGTYVRVYHTMPIQKRRHGARQTCTNVHSHVLADRLYAIPRHDGKANKLDVLQ